VTDGQTVRRTDLR